jgi:hypothetical protein
LVVDLASGLPLLFLCRVFHVDGGLKGRDENDCFELLTTPVSFQVTINPQPSTSSYDRSHNPNTATSTNAPRKPGIIRPKGMASTRLRLRPDGTRDRFGRAWSTPAPDIGSGFLSGAGADRNICPASNVRHECFSALTALAVGDFNGGRPARQSLMEVWRTKRPTKISFRDYNEKHQTD